MKNLPEMKSLVLDVIHPSSKTNGNKPPENASGSIQPAMSASESVTEELSSIFWGRGAAEAESEIICEAAS